MCDNNLYYVNDALKFIRVDIIQLNHRPVRV